MTILSCECFSKPVEIVVFPYKALKYNIKSFSAIISSRVRHLFYEYVQQRPQQAGDAACRKVPGLKKHAHSPLATERTTVRAIEVVNA